MSYFNISVIGTKLILNYTKPEAKLALKSIDNTTSRKGEHFYSTNVLIVSVVKDVNSGVLYFIGQYYLLDQLDLIISLLVVRKVSHITITPP